MSKSCDICTKTFNRNYILELHKQKCHPEAFDDGDKNLKSNVYNRRKMKKCRYCPKTFTGNLKLRDHERWHKGITYSCPFCNFEFTQPSHLRRHTEDVFEEIKDSFNFPNLFTFGNIMAFIKGYPEQFKGYGCSSKPGNKNIEMK